MFFCVCSFMKAEKLEFSSLRHAKFSTMLLLHALLSDKPPPERFPEAKQEPAIEIKQETAMVVEPTSTAS